MPGEVGERSDTRLNARQMLSQLYVKHFRGMKPSFVPYSYGVYKKFEFKGEVLGMVTHGKPQHLPADTRFLSTPDYTSKTCYLPPPAHTWRSSAGDLRLPRK